MMPPPERPPERPVDPAHRGPPRRRTAVGTALIAVGAALAVLLGAGLVVAGPAGDLLARLAASPTPAIPAAPTPTASRAPTSTASRAPAPTASPIATGVPHPSLDPSPAPTTPGAAAPPAAPAAGAPPTEAPSPFTMNLYRPGVFVRQADREWCVAAAAQNMLNVIRLTEDGTPPDTSARTQRALYRRAVELTTWDDSHNGGTGPGGWAALLTEHGYPYEVQVFETRRGALRAAATAVRETRRPVGILAWAGVHSWVMTGFTATADPAVSRDFTVVRARVLDPWYPWVSDRWPRSEKPNAPRDVADLEANVLRWRLASGPYPGRDGKYLLVVPLRG